MSTAVEHPSGTLNERFQVGLVHRGPQGRVPTVGADHLEGVVDGQRAQRPEVGLRAGGP
jgi:hypothetical protein